MSMCRVTRHMQYRIEIRKSSVQQRDVGDQVTSCWTNNKYLISTTVGTLPVRIPAPKESS